MSNYFIDTEFLESGPSRPVSLISIALVAEDGSEFYAESTHLDLEEAVAHNPWLKDNVVSKLVRTSNLLPARSIKDRFEYMHPNVSGGVMSYDDIGPSILSFLGSDLQPKFWGYYSDYDWVVFCQLYGTMVQKPKHFPFFCRDLKQEMARLGITTPQLSNENYHNALGDARWTKKLYHYLTERGLVPF